MLWSLKAIYRFLDFEYLFSPQYSNMFQAFFNASSLLFAFTPPAVTPVTFSKHEADKEQGRA